MFGYGTSMCAKLHQNITLKISLCVMDFHTMSLYCVVALCE
jgi:hypothetical protein